MVGGTSTGRCGSEAGREGRREGGEDRKRPRLTGRWLPPYRRRCRRRPPNRDKAGVRRHFNGPVTSQRPHGVTEGDVIGM